MRHFCIYTVNREARFSPPFMFGDGVAVGIGQYCKHHHGMIMRPWMSPVRVSCTVQSGVEA